MHPGNPVQPHGVLGHRRCESTERTVKRSSTAVRPTHPCGSAVVWERELLKRVKSWPGPVWWAREELNLRPLPCQLTRAYRCAKRRFPRSRSTVDGKVKCCLVEDDMRAPSGGEAVRSRPGSFTALAPYRCHSALYPLSPALTATAPNLRRSRSHLQHRLGQHQHQPSAIALAITDDRRRSALP